MEKIVGKSIYNRLLAEDFHKSGISFKLFAAFTGKALEFQWKFWQLSFENVDTSLSSERRCIFLPVFSVCFCSKYWETSASSQDNLRMIVNECSKIYKKKKKLHWKNLRECLWIVKIVEKNGRNNVKEKLSRICTIDLKKYNYLVLKIRKIKTKFSHIEMNGLNSFTLSPFIYYIRCNYID